MKSLSLLCLAVLLLGLAGCETTGTTSPAAPAAPVAATPPAPAKQLPSTLDQLPVRLVHVDPVSPFEARQAGITGYVVVEFTINKNGDVVDAVAVTATYPAFISPALSCVTRWKYSPGMKNGHPVSCRTREKITFG